MMKLIINGKNTNFSLENEKDAKDILEFIKDWGNEKGFFLSKFLLNKKPIDLLKKAECLELSKIVIENIEEVKVIFLPVLSYAFSTLVEISGYVKKVSIKVKDKNLKEKELDLLVENLSLIKEGVKQISNIISGIENQCFKLKSIIKQLEIAFFNLKKMMTQDENKEAYKAIMLLLEKLLIEINDCVFRGNTFILKKALVNGNINLKDFVKDFSFYCGELELILTKASTVFQCGKDLEGINYIQDITGAFELFILFIQYLDLDLDNGSKKYKKKIFGEKSTKDWINALKAHLLEIEKLIKSKDYVKLSDVLEYELVEMLENIN